MRSQPLRSSKLPSSSVAAPVNTAESQCCPAASRSNGVRDVVEVEEVVDVELGDAGVISMERSWE